MAKIGAVISREYFQRVHNKWFVFGTLLGPVLLGAMLIIPAWLSLRTRGTADLANTVVLDASGTGLGERVSRRLASGPIRARRTPEVRVLPAAELSRAESTITRAVMQKRYNGYIVLDEQTTNGEQARYAGRSASSLPDMARLRDAVRTSVLAERLESRGIAPDAVEDITFLPLQLATERITDKGRGGSGRISVVFAVVVAFLLYMSIILYGQAIMRGVMEEKQTRVAEVVVASVKPDILLAGKVVGVGGVGVTQLLVWMLAGWVLMKYRSPVLGAFGIHTAIPVGLPEISLVNAVLLMLFFVLGFVFYAALFAAVGAMVNSEEEAQQAVMPVMMLVIAAALLIQPVVFNPTGSLAQWSSLLPFSAPIIMPVRLSTISVPWSEIIAGLVILVLAGAAVLWVAARIYRVGLLMYGKRPTLRELARWIRYA